jgi:hypothetical protein
VCVCEREREREYLSVSVLPPLSALSSIPETRSSDAFSYMKNERGRERKEERKKERKKVCVRACRNAACSRVLA